jgi:hypothetical protein
MLHILGKSNDVFDCLEGRSAGAVHRLVWPESGHVRPDKGMSSNQSDEGGDDRTAAFLAPWMTGGSLPEGGWGRAT